MTELLIKTEVAKLWLKDGILHCKLKPGSEVNLDHAKDIIKISSMLANGKFIPVLGDLSEVKSMSKESRDILSKDTAKNIASHLAIITRSPISKVIGNFFVGINKPPYPVKLFTSEEKAILWLKTHARNKGGVRHDE